MPYSVTKTYGQAEGLSCCFRQWRATHSHCSLLHGYALGFRLHFQANDLDTRNWVQDFGGLKPVKTWLKSMFDHTLVVAKDDPQLEWFKQSPPGLMDLKVLDRVGCESFAELVWYETRAWMLRTDSTCANLTQVDCFEHDGNSASFAPHLAADNHELILDNYTGMQ